MVIFHSYVSLPEGIMFLSRKGSKDWGSTKGKKGASNDQMVSNGTLHWQTERETWPTKRCWLRQISRLLGLQIVFNDDIRGRQWRHGFFAAPGNPSRLFDGARWSMARSPSAIWRVPREWRRAKWVDAPATEMFEGVFQWYPGIHPGSSTKTSSWSI